MKRAFVSFVFGILLITFGIMVAMSNEELICIAMGIALVASGISSLRTAFAYSWENSAGKMVNLIKGAVCLVFGLLAIFNHNAGSSLFHALLYVMGAVIGLSGVISIVGAIQLRIAGQEAVMPVLFEGIFSLIIAAVLFITPSGVGKAILLVGGIVMIVLGLGSIFAGIHILKSGREAKDVEGSAEVIAEDAEKAEGKEGE